MNRGKGSFKNRSTITGVDFASPYRAVGRVSAWAVFFLEIAYVVTTALGFLSLPSPGDPIGDPFFTIMEVLIVLIAPLMVLTMIAVYGYAAPEDKAYGLTALIFMILMAGTTSAVHFAILTVSRAMEATGSPVVPFLFAFKWPSVVYALDILAWDWFFALAMLFAAPVFRAGRLEKAVRVVMIVSGGLSLAGLIGVPMGNVQVRNIGIIGYGIAAPIAFLLIGLVLGRGKSTSVQQSRENPL